MNDYHKLQDRCYLRIRKSLLPLGFLILGVGLYRERIIPRWQSAAVMLAMLGLGVSAAVDIDLFGLVATVILAIALIPLGYRIAGASSE